MLLERDNVLAMGAVFFILLVIDLFSQAFWIFSASTLIAWTVGNVAYHILRPSYRGLAVPYDWGDFLAHTLTVLGSTALVALLLQEIMPNLFTAIWQSPKPIDLGSVLVLSLIASAVAYLLPNLETLLARRRIPST